MLDYKRRFGKNIKSVCHTPKKKMWIIKSFSGQECGWVAVSPRQWVTWWRDNIVRVREMECSGDWWVKETRVRVTQSLPWYSLPVNYHHHQHHEAETIPWQNILWLVLPCSMLCCLTSWLLILIFIPQVASRQDRWIAVWEWVMFL